MIPFFCCLSKQFLELRGNFYVVKLNKTLPGVVCCGAPFVLFGGGCYFILPRLSLFALRFDLFLGARQGVSALFSKVYFKQHNTNT